MAIVICLCEVKSCTRRAENVFETRGGKLFVCNAHGFVSLRSPECRRWKVSQLKFKMPIQFSDHVAIKQNGAQDVKIFGPDLKIIKPIWSGPFDAS